MTKTGQILSFLPTKFDLNFADLAKMRKLQNLNIAPQRAYKIGHETAQIY